MQNNNIESVRTRKIVILFIIDLILSRYGFLGGTEKQLIEKINRLDKKKFKPILICLQKRYHNQIWDDIDCEKIPLHIYSIRSLTNTFKFHKLYRILKQKNVDIIEAVFFDSILIGVVIGVLAGVKNIITCRRDMGFWYNKKLLNLFFCLNRYTKRVLVNSNAIKKNVIEKEKVKEIKVDVIYNGIDIFNIEATKKVDLCTEYSSIERWDKIVGIVANFNRYVKRLDVFIKSIEIVISQYKNVKFIIFGEGKLKQKLKDLVNKCKVEEFVVWAGVKRDVVPYIKNFNVGVISSDSEGFCNAIIEYMATGIPVVATNVGGNVELIKDGYSGFLIPPGNHVLLAIKILQLLNNDKLAYELGQNGKVEVYNRYSWEKIINEYEKYYSDIVMVNE